MEDQTLKETTEQQISALQTFIDSYGGKIITAAIVLVVGAVLIKLLMNLTAKALRKSRLDVTMHKFLLSTIRIILYILLGLTVLQLFNVPMGSVIAALSVVGLAVSLAVKDSLANVASGIILLFSKPFEVGDYVQIDGDEGTVIHINMVNTKLNTFDNKAIYIPNSLVASNTIVNFTREDTRRLDLVFSVSYHDDFEAAKRLIARLIDANPLAINEPAPVVRVCEHAQSSINIAAKVWVKSDDYWNLKYDLLESVKHEFDKNGISIPFHQVDVRYMDQKKN